MPCVVYNMIFQTNPTAGIISMMAPTSAASAEISSILEERTLGSASIANLAGRVLCIGGDDDNDDIFWLKTLSSRCYSVSALSIPGHVAVATPISTRAPSTSAA